MKLFSHLAVALVLSAASTLAQASVVTKSINGTLLGEPLMQGDFTTGTWAEVSIRYMYKCTQKFETFASLIERQDGGSVKIYATAVVSETPVKPGQVACASEMERIETVIVDGVMALPASSIELVNMELKGLDLGYGKDSLDVPEGTESIGVVHMVSVDAVSDPICPHTKKCGVAITLSTSISCVNQLGGIASVAVQDGDKIKLKLFVAVYHNNLEPVVLCSPESLKRTFELVYFGPVATKPENVIVELLHPTAVK